MKLITDDGQEFGVESVRAADLAPGDVIVLTYPGVLYPEVGDRLRAAFRSLLPNNRAIVIEQGLDLSVLRTRVTALRAEDEE